MSRPAPSPVVSRQRLLRRTPVAGLIVSRYRSWTDRAAGRGPSSILIGSLDVKDRSGFSGADPGWSLRFGRSLRRRSRLATLQEAGDARDADKPKERE